MTQAENDTTRRLISIADLNTEIDADPRIQDILLGERLGFDRPRDVRKLVERNIQEIQLYGVCATVAQTTGPKGGRPGKAYYLNEPQALLICMFSNTAKAAEVRKMLIDVFMEYRRGKGMVKVQAHERRTSTTVDNAIRLSRSIDRLEVIANGMSAPHPHNGMSAMNVNGEPVIVDVLDFDMSRGGRAVVLKWDGSIAITEPSNVRLEENRFGRDDVMRIEKRTAYARHQLHGARTGYMPPEGNIRHGCVILGKIVSDQPPRHTGTMRALNTPAGRTVALPNNYRGRRVLYRDEILRLLGTKMTNRQIAQKTGATYQTVTHWRRWAADHQPELLAA